MDSKSLSPPCRCAAFSIDQIFSKTVVTMKIIDGDPICPVFVPEAVDGCFYFCFSFAILSFAMIIRSARILCQPESYLLLHVVTSNA